MTTSRAARVVGLSVAGYLLLWGLTAVFGTAQVQRAVLDGLRRGGGPASGEPQAKATSPAPLFVRVHYGNRSVVPLAGHGLRPTPLRRRASRPQLKRDPLGSAFTEFRLMRQVLRTSS